MGWLRSAEHTVAVLALIVVSVAALTLLYMAVVGGFARVEKPGEVLQFRVEAAWFPESDVLVLVLVNTGERAVRVSDVAASMAVYVYAPGDRLVAVARGLDLILLDGNGDGVWEPGESLRVYAQLSSSLARGYYSLSVSVAGVRAASSVYYKGTVG